MYICELCNYQTEYSGNFSNHKKTKKHQLQVSSKNSIANKKTIAEYQKGIKLVSNEYQNSIKDDTIENKKTIVQDSSEFQCENCGNSFKHKNNYYRHRKSCNKTNKELEYKIKFENVEKEYKMQLEYEKKEKELYKKLEQEKSEMLNNFMNNANTLLNKAQDNTKITAQAMQNVSMSALKYANEKFKNAPALLPLENFNINDLDFNNKEDKKQLIEILIYNSRHKSLDKLLGDHIVNNYKKKNLEEQTFHTTDCSRLNYIVRELMENALIWSIDKNGIKICSSVIKPLIKKCITPLLEYQKELLEEMGKGDYSKQADVELIINLIISMESGTLETEINKYIAPYFNLDKNKLKEF
jgi:hypothetical protein